jgi:hypothetical protein
MILRLHPTRETDQEKKQRGIEQNYANAALVVRLHH